MPTEETPPSPPPTPGMTVIRDLGTVKKNVGTLLELAEVIGKHRTDGRGFLDQVIHLLDQLVAGVEENRQSLASLHATLLDPRLSATIRDAMRDI